MAADAAASNRSQCALGVQCRAAGSSRHTRPALVHAGTRARARAAATGCRRSTPPPPNLVPRRVFRPSAAGRSPRARRRRSRRTPLRWRACAFSSQSWSAGSRSLVREPRRPDRLRAVCIRTVLVKSWEARRGSGRANSRLMVPNLGQCLYLGLLCRGWSSSHLWLAGAVVTHLVLLCSRRGGGQTVPGLRARVGELHVV